MTRQYPTCVWFHSTGSWHPSAALLYTANEFTLLVRTSCIFPSCWTEGNESELKGNRMPSADKWFGIFLLKVNYVHYMCPVYDCTRHRQSMCRWQKLTGLTCSLHGALEEPWTSWAPGKELGSAWNAVWFSMWSPCSPAKVCRDLDSAPLRLVFQKETAQLSSCWKNLRGDGTHVTVQCCL